MSVQDIPAIDVHAHYGRYMNSSDAFRAGLMTGDLPLIQDRAKAANIRYTFVSPLQGLMPRFNADPITANRDAYNQIEHAEGVYQYVIVDPLKEETFTQAREMVSSPKCVGIKIHPEEHGYSIREHGERLFSLAAELRTVLIGHSGEQNSLPADYVEIANEFPETPLIISHLGCGWDGDLTHQVRAIQRSKHGNVYTDTSSASGITSGLLEWAVKEIGSEKILFGTDSPLYFAPMQRARVNYAEISDNDKMRILYDNAFGIFKLRNGDVGCDG